MLLEVCIGAPAFRVHLSEPPVLWVGKGTRSTAMEAIRHTFIADINQSWPNRLKVSPNVMYFRLLLASFLSRRHGPCSPSVSPAEGSLSWLT